MVGFECVFGLVSSGGDFLFGLVCVPIVIDLVLRCLLVTFARLLLVLDVVVMVMGVFCLLCVVSSFA